MKMMDTIGVKYLMLMKASIVGMWLFLAAPKIILDVENRILLTKPNVDKATKIDTTQEYCPISFSAKV